MKSSIYDDEFIYMMQKLDSQAISYLYFLEETIPRYLSLEGGEYVQRF